MVTKMHARFGKTEYVGKDKNIRVEKRTVDSVGMHTHDYFELEIVVDGEGRHWLNAGEHPISRGSVLFLSPADCHSVRCEKTATLWNISFDESALPEALLKKVYGAGGCHRNFDEETLSRLVAAAELLEKETAATGHVQPLLGYILELVLPKRETERPTPLQDALFFAQTHFRESPTVAQAAEAACLSPVYFGYLFKKTYGVGFSEYVNRRKVECAKLLLGNGVSVAQSCFDSGFNSLSNFLRVFKAETGVSPKEYQKRKEQGV